MRKKIADDSSLTSSLHSLPQAPFPELHQGVAAEVEEARYYAHPVVVVERNLLADHKMAYTCLCQPPLSLSSLLDPAVSSM